MTAKTPTPIPTPSQSFDTMVSLLKAGKVVMSPAEKRALGLMFGDLGQI